MYKIDVTIAENFYPYVHKAIQLSAHQRGFNVFQ
jgi:hypothetical protein